MRFFEDGHEELCNFKEDIGEMKNLADSEPEKRAELSAKLTAWQEGIEALIARAESGVCAVGGTGAR